MEPTAETPGESLVHPKKNSVKVILAVGWSTGLVTIWDGSNKDRKEIQEISENIPITQLAWSLPNGKRLVSGNTHGEAKAWRANNKGEGTDCYLQNKFSESKLFLKYRAKYG